MVHGAPLVSFCLAITVSSHHLPVSFLQPHPNLSSLQIITAQIHWDVSRLLLLLILHPSQETHLLVSLVIFLFVYFHLLFCLSHNTD